MNAVTHHGRETAYRHSDRGGDGRSTLLVHGSGGTHRVWKSQFRLSDERPVAALDLSGRGASEDVAAAPGYGTLSAYADDVLAVAQDVEAEVLVGNSLGGAVLLHLVTERGYDPDALVLVGSGAKLAVNEALLSWLDDDFDRAVSFLHGEDRLFHDPTPAMLSLSRSAMEAVGRDVTRRDFRTCHGFDVREELSSVAAPVLAVVGEHDQLTPPWYHEYLADELPDAALAIVQDAAHLAMLEQPRAVNAALDAFLDEL